MRMDTVIERGRKMIEQLTSKAKLQRGGVFLWQDDWEAIVRKLEALEKEADAFRKMLHDTDTIRASEMGKH